MKFFGTSDWLYLAIDPSERCQFIVVNGSSFNAAFPRKGDLKYFCHARSINTGGRVIDGI
jgi:hypothetical protein